MPRFARPMLLAASTLLLAACTDTSSPDAPRPATTPAPMVLATYADTLAQQTLDAYGGAEAWAALPHLRFDFAFERDGDRRTIRRHLWSRHDGRYRVEWSASPDSHYVVLFDTDTRAGNAYLNGAAVADAEQANLLERAYSNFINDTYWLLLPVKLLDPGVNRTYLPDSSDATTEVLQLTFGDVGLTPGDRYYIYLDKNTHHVRRWGFVLENMDTDAAPRFYDWSDEQQFATPAGGVTMAARKAAVGRNAALLTDNLAVHTDETLPADIFSDPMPRL